MVDSLAIVRVSELSYALGLAEGERDAYQRRLAALVAVARQVRGVYCDESDLTALGRLIDEHDQIEERRRQEANP